MADIVTWPWPRFIQTEFNTFHASKLGNNIVFSEAIIDSNASWSFFPVLNLGQYTEIESITVADFGPFYIVATYGEDALGTIVRHMYVRDLEQALNYQLTSFTEQTDVRCGTILNNNGQFIGANIVAEPGHFWQQLNSRSVIWGGIGSYELDPESDITAGSIGALVGSAQKNNPEIVRLMRLGENIIAYGQSSNVVLSPSFTGGVFSYGSRRLTSYGILSGNHVAGDDTLQCFIDISGDLWQIEANNRLTKRGYREYIKPLIDSGSQIIMSYVPDRQKFYISNGVECLVVSAFGAYKCHQLVSSVISTPHGVYATWKDTGDETAYITTDQLDFSARGMKTVESMQAAYVLADGKSRVDFSVDWKSDSGSTFHRSAKHRADPNGRSTIRVTANAFRLHIDFNSYMALELTELQSDVKFPDARYRRGTTIGGGNEQ